MIILAIYILWVLYSIFEGKREALYYSFKMKATIIQQQSYKQNEHIMFTIQRLFVLIIACISFYYSYIECLLLFTSLIICFPFFHDGEYYVTRRTLDRIYPKGWLSQSTTSTALSDKLELFGPINRILFFAISLAIAIFEIIKYWK